LGKSSAASSSMLDRVWDMRDVLELIEQS